MALRIVEIDEVMEELVIKKNKFQEFASLFLFWSQQLKSKGNCRTQWKWKLHCKKILTGAMRGRGGLSALQVDLKSKTKFKVKLDHLTCRWRRSKTEWGKLKLQMTILQFYHSWLTTDCFQNIWQKSNVLVLIGSFRECFQASIVLGHPAAPVLPKSRFDISETHEDLAFDTPLCRRLKLKVKFYRL